MPVENSELRERILDKALELGEAASWEALRLHAVADALDISLDDIRVHYAQKDDLVEAWFDRADSALLRGSPDDDVPGLAPHQRVKRSILRWLEALAPHRRLTREMLAYKFEFGHVHLQALGVMRISRTVQWFRESARLDSTGLQRIVEETSLTAIYLGTFARWLFDDSADNRNTRRVLERSLEQWQTLCCRNEQRPVATTTTDTARPAAR